MEQSPQEANSHSAGQEIPRLAWNPNIYYCAHKSPPMVPILSRCIQSTPSHPISLR